MKRLIILLVLASFILASCYTTKCYPSKRSKDWAIVNNQNTGI